MLLTSALFACVDPGAADSGAPKDTAGGETSTDSAHTGETGDTAETGETGETAETGDSGETGETGASPGVWPPPSWLDATAMTVPTGRGEAWAEDTGFALTGFSVPHAFVMPDGRYGMLVTDMRGTDTFPSRFLLESDDGLTWTEAGGLLYPDDWATPCGEKLTHATLWRETEDTWTVLVEGAPADSGMELFGPRPLCAASTHDFLTWEYAAAPVFSGVTDEDLISIPAALSVGEGDAIIWYNGDLDQVTPEGAGIRTIRLAAGTRAWEVLQDAPIFAGTWHDVTPVYREDGGVRLYTRYAMEDETSGLAMVDLDDELTPIGDPVAILPASGTCFTWPWTGTCTGDPTYLQLPDGRLVLYYYRNDFAEDGTATFTIGRAFATD